jgi:ankyrin repeat protein
LGVIDLGCSAAKGNEATINVLLDHGADLDGCDCNGNKPDLLLAAAGSGQYHTFRFLVTRGANLHRRRGALPTNYNEGEWALECAIYFANLPMVLYLIEAGVPLVNTNQWVDPVTVAIKHGQLGILKVLLRLGAEEKDIGDATDWGSQSD